MTIIFLHFSISLLQLSNPIPEVLKEPTFELIKSLSISDYFKNHLSFEEIEKGFKKCNFPFKKISEKTINSITNNTKTNVILITLESVHWKYVNIFGKEPKTWPLLSKLKDRMEIFPLIYSNYPESTCGDYAMVTSLVPYNHLFLNINKDMIHKGLVNELKKIDYDAYIFSSGSLFDGGLINIIKTQPFDYKFNFQSKNSNNYNSWEWGYKEEYTTKKIIEFLKKREKDKPYFLWYRTVYPHAPFTQFGSNEHLLFQEKNENGALSLVSKYKNALTYLDKVLYNFINEITELDEKNGQKTLIVMVGDHGEKLREKDNDYTTGHGLNTTPQLQNVVCIFIKPQNDGLKINKNFGSQIDITPTILDYLKIEPSVERYEQGQSLYRKDLLSRPIYLSSMESYAIIEDGYFFEFRDKNSPNFRVTKLNFSEEELKPTYEQLPN